MLRVFFNKLVQMTLHSETISQIYKFIIDFRNNLNLKNFRFLFNIFIIEIYKNGELCVRQGCIFSQITTLTSSKSLCKILPPLPLTKYGYI